MAIRPSLELRQTQRLAMTPQLRQAIRMLGMSAQELGAFLAAEVEANPLLSLAEPTTEGETAAAPPPDPADSAPLDATLRAGDLAAGAAALESAPENLYEAADGPGPGGGGAGGLDPFESEGAAALAAPVTLADHVRGQLGLARLSPQERFVAEALLSELDEDGYLRASDAEIGARLGVATETVARAAAAIRACDPTGVGARDLADCLALQLADAGALDAAATAVLDNLAMLAEAPAAEAAARCGVTPEAMAATLAALRRLDPRPGRRFAPQPLAPAAPDALVRREPGGDWTVTLNPEATPRLIVDRRYAARVAGGDRPEARLFIDRCAQSAGWLRRSLDQRARTILKVATEIARRQSGFLDHGVSALRPMTLRDVAEAAGVHESTASRVTANKTLATPRGVFEMRFFFTAALGEGEAAHSAAAVRARIRDLVAAEPAGKPLSDDRLVKLLNAEGVEVARRTVAKYREALGIPSSVERRRRAGAAAALC